MEATPTPRHRHPGDLEPADSGGIECAVSREVLLPLDPPERLSRALRAFFLNGLTLGQFARRKPGSYIGDMRQNSPSVADPRAAGISRSIDPREGNSGKQTTKETQLS